MKPRNLVLYTLACVNFTHIVDSMLIMPLGDIFIEEFQISAREYSFLVSAYAIAAFISSLFGIFLLDIFDRKRALLFLYTGFAIGTFCCAYSHSYIFLISLRFITGIFGGLIGAMVLSIVSDLFLFKERGKAMGILMAAFSAASALGIPIGIYFAALESWQLPFRVLGLMGMGISCFIFFKFPNLTGHLNEIDPNRSLKNTLSNILSDRNQVNALMAGFILVLGHFLIIPFISPYMIKNVGLTQMEISYQFFFGGVFTVISSPLVGRFTDKIGVLPVFITVMSLSFIPTVLITQMPVVSLTYAVFITSLFFIFGTARMIPPQTIITAAASPFNRGSFMSLKSALQQLAIALSAFISGMIIKLDDTNRFVNYEYVGYLSIVLGIFTIYMISRLRVAKGN